MNSATEKGLSFFAFASSILGGTVGGVIIVNVRSAFTIILS
jgi:hypothetical protein